MIVELRRAGFFRPLRLGFDSGRTTTTTLAANSSAGASTRAGWRAAGGSMQLDGE
jgi:hypothetical protein